MSFQNPIYSSGRYGRQSGQNGGGSGANASSSAFDTNRTDSYEQLLNSSRYGDEVSSVTGFVRPFSAASRPFDYDLSGYVEDDEFIFFALGALATGQAVDERLFLANPRGREIMDMLETIGLTVDPNTGAMFLSDSQAITAALYKNSDFGETVLGDTDDAAIEELFKLNTNASALQDLVNLVDKEKDGIISDEEVARFLTENPALDQTGLVSDILSRNENYASITTLINAVDFSQVGGQANADDARKDIRETLLQFRADGLDDAVITQIENRTDEARGMLDTIQILDADEDGEFGFEELITGYVRNFDDLDAYMMNYIEGDEDTTDLVRNVEPLAFNPSTGSMEKINLSELTPIVNWVLNQTDLLDSEGVVNEDSLKNYFSDLKNINPGFLTAQNQDNLIIEWQVARELSKDSEYEKYWRHLDPFPLLSLYEITKLEIELRNSQSDEEREFIEEFIINTPDTDLDLIKLTLDFLDDDGDNYMSDSEFLNKLLMVSRGEASLEPQIFDAFASTNPNIQQLNNLIDNIDTNLNGQISELEALNLVLAERRGDVVMNDVIFETFLSDPANIGFNEDLLPKLIKAADIIDPNKDGFVDLDEATNYELQKRQGLIDLGDETEILKKVMDDSDPLKIYKSAFKLVFEDLLDADGDGDIRFDVVSTNYDAINNVGLAAYQEFQDAYDFLDYFKDEDGNGVPEGFISFDDLAGIESDAGATYKGLSGAEAIEQAYNDIGFELNTDPTTGFYDKDLVSLINMPALLKEDVFGMANDMLRLISTDVDIKMKVLEDITSAHTNGLNNLAAMKDLIKSIRDPRDADYRIDPNETNAAKVAKQQLASELRFTKDNIVSDVFSLNPELADYVSALNAIDLNRNGQISDRETVLGMMVEKKANDLVNQFGPGSSLSAPESNFSDVLDDTTSPFGNSNYNSANFVNSINNAFDKLDSNGEKFIDVDTFLYPEITILDMVELYNLHGTYELPPDPADPKYNNFADPADVKAYANDLLGTTYQELNDVGQLMDELEPLFDEFGEPVPDAADPSGQAWGLKNRFHEYMSNVHLELQKMDVDQNGQINDDDIIGAIAKLRRSQLGFIPTDAQGVPEEEPLIWSPAVQTVLDSSPNLDKYVELVDKYAPNGFMDEYAMLAYAKDVLDGTLSTDEALALTNIPSFALYIGGNDNNPNQVTSLNKVSEIRDLHTAFISALNALDPNGDFRVTEAEYIDVFTRLRPTIGLKDENGNLIDYDGTPLPAAAGVNPRVYNPSIIEGTRSRVDENGDGQYTTEDALARDPDGWFSNSPDAIGNDTNGDGVYDANDDLALVNPNNVSEGWIHDRPEDNERWSHIDTAYEYDKIKDLDFYQRAIISNVDGSIVTRPVLDRNGTPLVDANGQIIYEAVTDETINDLERAIADFIGSVLASL